MKLKGLGLVAAGLLVFSGENVFGSPDELAGPSILVMQENDLVVRTDRHYTQGLKFNFLAGEHHNQNHWTERWADAFPRLGMKEVFASRYGLGMGQSIFTPTDISTPALQLDDRPYAGFFYTELMLQRRGETSDHTPALDHFGLTLGIIGPPSLAEEAQNTVHRLRNFGLAYGWGNQLTVEFGSAFKYERRLRYSAGSSEGWEAQLIPHWGISVGNVGTYGAVGGQVRAGWHISDDFGWRTVDSTIPNTGGKVESQKQIGAWVLVAVEGRAIAYNTFLDGNMFHKSHHVAKKPMVGDLMFGAVVAFRRFDIALIQVIRSKEFVGQKEIDAFGSVALRYKW